ncbi:hypothetical protein ACLB2K_023225 [Fragaria x ananassa]
MATYRALLSLKSSLDDPRRSHPLQSHPRREQPLTLSNLTLAENNLSGPIPPEISALSALRLLNLSNNVFNRTFPPELSNLTNLRVLEILVRIRSMRFAVHTHITSQRYNNQIHFIFVFIVIYEYLHPIDLLPVTQTFAFTQEVNVFEDPGDA